MFAMYRFVIVFAKAIKKTWALLFRLSGETFNGPTPQSYSKAHVYIHIDISFTACGVMRVLKFPITQALS